MYFCFKASTGFVPYRRKELDWCSEYCRENHTDLASVRNKSENNQTQTIINQNLTSPKQAWIGLHRFWVWSDNSTASFTHWMSGEPDSKDNRDRICTSTDMKWRTMDRRGLYRFISLYVLWWWVHQSSDLLNIYMSNYRNSSLLQYDCTIPLNQRFPEFLSVNVFLQVFKLIFQ